MVFYKRKITISDDTVTNAVHLTTKQSLLPNLLVYVSSPVPQLLTHVTDKPHPTRTILFFLWGFAYGLLDVLNSHFKSSLNISSSMASGLSAA